MHIQNQTRLVELHGQPTAYFAIASAAEGLADKLQCANADYSFNAVMTPFGQFVVVCTGEDETGSETFLGFV